MATYYVNPRETNLLPEANASRLLLGDCVDRLAEVPDNSIDCILTDPPYGFNYLSRSKTLPKVRIANDRFEAYPLYRSALQRAYPILKDDGVLLVFTNWQCEDSTKAITREEGFDIKNVLIWEKNAWSRGDLKGNWGYSYEMILFAKKTKTPSTLRRFLNGKREGNILKFKKLPTNYMQHPTEKPVELLQYLIEKVTQPGETVLDMFMGSGTTGVAASECGRAFIGIELEKVWFDVAAKRLGVTAL